jgi:hypothetical protein
MGLPGCARGVYSGRNRHCFGDCHRQWRFQPSGDGVCAPACDQSGHSEGPWAAADTEHGVLFERRAFRAGNDSIRGVCLWRSEWNDGSDYDRRTAQLGNSYVTWSGSEPSGCALLSQCCCSHQSGDRNRWRSGERFHIRYRGRRELTTFAIYNLSGAIHILATCSGVVSFPGLAWLGDRER